jgi:hypothetical protein
MPKVNVYLPDPLAESVRRLQIPLSLVCQRALEEEVVKRRSTPMGSGHLLHEGFLAKPPHKCQPPRVDTAQLPWTVLGKDVGATAKWECIDCRAVWLLGFDGNWSIDLSPIVGAVVDLFRSSHRAREASRVATAQPPRSAVRGRVTR